LAFLANAATTIDIGVGGSRHFSIALWEVVGTAQDQASTREVDFYYRPVTGRGWISRVVCREEARSASLSLD